MGRLGRRGVAGVCWALVLCAGLGAQRTRLPTKGLEHAFVEPRTPVELRRRLAGLEAQELPALFHLAVDGRLPDGSSAELPPLSDAERALVREALSARPRREIVPFLEDLSGRPLSVAECLEAQALLGSLGSGDHLKLLVRLTVPIQERGAVAPELRTGFTAALGAILARDAAALTQVASLLAESAPGLASALIEGLAAVRTAEATRDFAHLSRLLGVVGPDQHGEQNRAIDGQQGAQGQCAAADVERRAADRGVGAGQRRCGPQRRAVAGAQCGRGGIGQARHAGGGASIESIAPRRAAAVIVSQPVSLRTPPAR